MPTKSIPHKQDTWVLNIGGQWGSAPNINVQGDAIGRTAYGLIQFDLSEFKPGVTINSAKLYEYHYTYQDDPGTVTIAVHRVTSPWDEKTVTWDTKPSWDSLEEASITKTAGQWGYWVWDVTNLVKKWINLGVPNYGLMLRMTAWQPGKYGAIGFAAKEAVGYSHGYLLIDYTPMSTVLTLTPRNPTVVVGSDIVLDGFLKDSSGAGAGGENVTLQEYVNGQWVDKATTTTNPDGSYTFSLSGYGAGSYTFRTFYAGSTSYSSSTSLSVAVTVRKILTSLSLAADRLKQFVGGIVNFTGQLTTETGESIGGQIVNLQQQVDGSWTTIISGTTAPDGTVLLSKAMPNAGDFTFRMYYAGSDVYEPSTSNTITVRWEKYPTSLSLTADRLTAFVDDIVNFIGSLKNAATNEPIGGQAVKLQQLVGGSWTDILSGATDSNGSVTLSKAMPSVGDLSFRMYYAGSSAYEPSTSNAVTVSVKKIIASLTFMVDRTSVLVGEQVKFSGSLIRADTGQGIANQTIALKQLVDSNWNTISTATTRADGSFMFPVTFNREGLFSFKAVFEGTDKYNPAESSIIDITSIMPAVPTFLTLVVSSQSARVGESVTFSGTLKTESLEPVPEAIIVLEQQSGTEWVEVWTSKTNSSGFYSINKTFTEEGTFTFRTSFKGADPYGPSSSSPVTVVVLSAVPKRPVSRFMQRLDVDKTSVVLGETVKMWGNLTFTAPLRAIPIPFQRVVVYRDGEAVAFTVTDIRGSFEAEWKPAEAGTYDVYATANTRILGYKLAESNHIIITVSTPTR